MSAGISLKGKVAVVTGASSGLGERFAEILSNAGASVALAARRTDRLKSLADRVTASGGTAITVKLDVNDYDNIQAAFAEVRQKLGGTDILMRTIVALASVGETDQAKLKRFALNASGALVQ